MDAAQIRASLPALLAAANAARANAAAPGVHVHPVSLHLDGVIVGPAGSVGADVAVELSALFRAEGWGGCAVVDEAGGARLRTTR